MADVVADLHLGLKELAAEDRDTWGTAALSDRTRDLVGLHERTQVELLRTLALWDRRAAWGDDGAVTAVAWLKAHLDMAPGEAAAWVRLARVVDEFPAILDALDGGEITVAKVRVLARARAGREQPFAACVDGLVRLAGELALADLTQVLAEWAELVDEGDDPGPERRRLNLGTTGGTGRGVIEGPADDLEIMRAAIAALDTPDPLDGPEPPRTREQRQFDIAIDIFRRALVDELGDDPGAPGGVDLVVDAATVAELTTAPADGAAPSLDDLLAPYAEGDAARALTCRRHVDGRRASRAFVAALFCTGWLRRVIVDPANRRPLDVGRAHRRFTRRQFRALAIRDAGCVFPGCDRGPRWCDAHHLHEWEHGGPTDLDNGVLLCRRHHVLVHKRGWHLARDPRTGIVTALAPDGRRFTRPPRPPCRAGP